MMETRTVRTIDLPNGGFLVLDHIVSVSISVPQDQSPSTGDNTPWFSVDAITIHGARVHCASFALVGYEYSRRWPIDRSSSDYAETEARAEAFVAELRYCIENR